MKTKVKYKALTFEGKLVHKVLEHDLPDFEEKTVTLKMNGIPVTTQIPVTSQIMDHLDDMDKRDLMEENDWHTIIDYWVHVQKKKSEPVKKQVANLAKQYLEGLENAEQLMTDFLVVYVRMYDKIKKLKAEDQFKIVLETMGIGYDAQSEVYKRTIAMLRGEDESLNQRMLQHKNQNNGNQIPGTQAQA